MAIPFRTKNSISSKIKYQNSSQRQHLRVYLEIASVDSSRIVYGYIEQSSPSEFARSSEFRPHF